MKAVHFFLPVFFLSFFAQPVQAQGEAKLLAGSLEVSPAIAEVVLHRGKEEKLVLTFTNHSKKPVSVEVFPLDFKQKDGDGALSFLGQEAGSYSYSLSSFLGLESRTLELSSLEKKDFVVTIRDRADLSPGGHYAAVVARVVQKDGRPEMATLTPSLSSLILLRKVGGERFNLSLRDVSYPNGLVAFRIPSAIQLTFRNEGNVHLVPYGRVEVRDVLGRMIYKGVLNQGSYRVFPSAIRYIPVAMHTTSSWQLPISFHTLVISGQDSLKKTSYTYRETYLYINPWISVFLVVLLGFVIGVRRRRWARKSH
jgi:hypothetical protein